MGSVLTVKPVKLRLIHKGIILVSVPLLFELGFVGVLTSIQMQAEAEADRAARSKEISDLIGEIVQDAVAIAQTMDAQSIMHASQTIVEYRQRSNEIQQDFDRLEVLVKDDPRETKVVKEARSGIDEARKVFDHVVVLYENHAMMEMLEDLKANKQENKKSLHRVLSSELLSMAHTQKQNADEGPHKQAEFRRQVRQNLVLAVLFNILLTIALAVFFSRSIARKVAVLTDNSLRLASRRDLRPLLGGDDEISNLDKVFHNMADALDEADRLKQEVIAMVTHDLRTPITTISAFLELLEAKLFGELTEQGKGSLTAAQFSADRMMTLVNELLDIEKIKSGMMELEIAPVDITFLLNQTAASVRDWAAERKVSIKIAESNLTVNADAHRLTQVLINLSSNAIKFSPENSTVTLGANAITGGIQFYVQDQGAGIPADKIAKIFDRFQQVHATDAKEKGGSGLGLAICKAIVELHGGTIAVESSPGQGSKFTFVIPQKAIGTALLSTDQEALKLPG